MVEGEGVGHGVVTVVGGVVIVVRGEGGGLVGKRGRQGVVSGEGAGWLWLLEVVGWSLLSGEGAGDGGGGGRGWGSWRRRREGVVVAVGVVGEGIGWWWWSGRREHGVVIVVAHARVVVVGSAGWCKGITRNLDTRHISS
jgi:hypothetical protein